ncbi:MAG: hypothetical protein HQL36_06565 [Alphaproteobacteria bacterium]|nr:hypothetical protein [Alphaproteobacteria bacterium]MBF0250716.1 hypothetical protein [Alphaproteobacteria bacterium]
MRHGTFANLSLSALAVLTLAACAPQGSALSPNTNPDAAGATGAKAAQPEPSFNRFPDIPVPTGAKMDAQRTLVFGGGETWYGQLGLDATFNGDAMFDFYKQELGAFGWQEVTSVRAPVSVLTYERQGRVLSIQIEPVKLALRGESKVTLTVSPRAGSAPRMN